MLRDTGDGQNLERRILPSARRGKKGDQGIGAAGGCLRKDLLQKRRPFVPSGQGSARGTGVSS